MSDWHADESALRAYVGRHLEPLARASVDAHLTGCSACRRELARLARGSSGAVSFDGLWERVQTRVEHVPATRATRWLHRVGIAERDAVIVRQIGRQSLQWTLATTTMLAVAAFAAALGARDTARFAFVVFAPLLPPLGVAATYRLTPTSTAALETTSPYSPARLLLWRTGYALVTAVPASVAFAAIIPGNPWLTVAWLLPCAACTLLVLVAATWTEPSVPALVVSTGWIAVVAGWHVQHLPDAVTTPATQLASLAVAVAAGAAFAHRMFVLRIPMVPSRKVPR